MGTIDRRVGRLLGANSRAAGLYDIQVIAGNAGHTQIIWTKKDDWRDWAMLSEGCYLLRSNFADLPPADLWQAYIGLTQAEAAFHFEKSELHLRPIWHQ